MHPFTRRLTDQHRDTASRYPGRILLYRTKDPAIRRAWCDHAVLLHCNAGFGYDIRESPRVPKSVSVPVTGLVALSARVAEMGLGLSVVDPTPDGPLVTPYESEDEDG